MADKSEKRRYFVCTAAFLVAAVVFCALSFAYMQNFKETMTEENRFQLSEVSGHIATYMRQMVNDRKRELTIAAKSYAALPEDVEKDAYLSKIAEEPGFEYIGVAGADGVLHAPALPAPKNISGQEYYKTALSGEPAVSDITRQIFSDRVVSGVMMAVLVPDGSKQVMAALLDTSVLGENIRVDSFNGEGYSYIIDGDGELVLNSRSRGLNNLFRSFQNMEFEKGYSLQRLENDIREHREGMAAYSDLGVDKYAYYRPLEVNDWTIVSTVPKGVVTERTGALTRDLAILCAAAMLVFLLLLLTVVVLYLRLEKKKQANQARTTFLANMSHDMRTPMNAMIGMASIAGSHADEPGTVRDCTKKIISSGRHLLGLINDVLDMSKIESGQMMLRCEPMSLPEVLHETVDLVYPQISARRQHFSIVLRRVEHERLSGDPMRLQQVFVNILTNASKFTPEEGSITVSVEEQPQGAGKMPVFRFVFTDTGIGMKKEFLENVFNAFSRELDSKVDKTEGSGLGMAISKNIMDLMGGSISVASEEGKGSTFVVTVPLRPEPEQEETSELPSCHVLIVDGEEARENANESETVRSLRLAGASADLRTDAASAAESILKARAAREDYDFVLIDRRFFDSGEWEHIKAAILPGQRLILAAFSWEDIREEVFAAGFCHILPKPIFKSGILRCLNALLLEKTAVPPEYGLEPVLKGKTVLLAEDNELNMEIARALFEDAGALAVSAGNGEECLNIFLASPEGHFDLILMDIQMPLMNGYETAKAIRRLERADSGVPIIAMSANTFAEDKEAARLAGISGYLVKPIDMSVWMEEIKKYI